MKNKIGSVQKHRRKCNTGLSALRRSNAASGEGERALGGFLPFCDPCLWGLNSEGLSLSFSPPMVLSCVSCRALTLGSIARSFGAGPPFHLAGGIWELALEGGFLGELSLIFKFNRG